VVTQQEHVELEVLAEKDRRSRAPRTAGQVGIGGGFFVILDYVLRGFFDIDLDPNGAGTEMPPLVVVAFTTLATYAVSLYMNRKSDSVDVVETEPYHEEFV
jgi:hypothetical protein